MMVNILLCVGWGPPPRQKLSAHTSRRTHTQHSSPTVQTLPMISSCAHPGPTCHSAFVPVSLQSLSCSPCPRDSQAGLCPKTSWRTGSNTGSWTPAPVLDSVVLDLGCRICICPGDAVHLGTTLREPLSYAKLFTSDPVPRLLLLPPCTPRVPLKCQLLHQALSDAQVERMFPPRPAALSAVGLSVAA